MSQDTIRQALLTYLKSQPDVTALIGSRIYILSASQTVGDPHVVYSRISATRSHAKAGPSGLTESRVQFSIWSKWFREAWAVAEALRHALDGFSGIMNGVNIRAIRSDGEADFFESDTKLYQVASDFLIVHE